MQAAVHECLGDAIGQYCRVVGQDSSDKEDSDSETDGCTVSFSESDSDVLADLQTHSTGKTTCTICVTAKCMHVRLQQPATAI